MITSLLLVSYISRTVSCQHRLSSSLIASFEGKEVAHYFSELNKDDNEEIALQKNELIKRNIQPLSSFRENPSIRRIYHNNEAQIAKAYERYYTTRYNQLKDVYDKKGNPGTMI